LKALNASAGKTLGAHQRVAVFGAGVSGQAARRLAHALELEVCLFDEAGHGDSDDFAQDRLSEFDLFIFSPGFAARHPWRMLAERSGRPCYSELGFAAINWRGKLLGVTGTNGKTSITSFLCAALQKAGKKAAEAGNIGTPLSDVVLSEVNQVETIAVCEISSFQAELCTGLAFDGLIWSNFAEDHLDRYDSMSEYFAAKSQLFKCLKDNAPSVLGTDVVQFAPQMMAGHGSITVDRDCAVELEPESPFQIEPQRTNFALVSALWQALELPVDALVAVGNSFQLPEHRLNLVTTWGDVSFWNDSKATNFHAAAAAVNAMHGTLFWIGGGSGKGGDLGSFARLIAPKINMAFLYGEVAGSLATSLRAQNAKVEIHADFVATVQAATRAAIEHSPAIVLLSPGFASFDQFSSYSARGKTFISTVFSLKDAFYSN
jgi:UDP-N-acetylmuramoylalanine--D-glutamate ligase